MNSSVSGKILVGPFMDEAINELQNIYALRLSQMGTYTIDCVNNYLKNLYVLDKILQTISAKAKISYEKCALYLMKHNLTGNMKGLGLIHQYL